MALQFDLSIRDYVRDKIRPVMYEYAGEEEFIPETMSTSFVARSIFEDITEHFPGFILKFSSDNPRNPRNQAGPEELKIIEYFNKHPKETTWQGNIPIGNKLYYANFKARRMEESCLRCHGDPADAPESLIKRYGATAGFYRPVGDVIALDSVAIPISSIQEQLLIKLRNHYTLIAIGFFILLGSLYIVVKLFISNRLATIAEHFTETAAQKEFVGIEQLQVQGNDEIAALAGSFNALAEKLRKYHDSLETEIKERSKANVLLQDKILEQQRTEEARKQAETTLEHVLTNANPLCITSVTFDILQANDAYYKIWPKSEVKTDHMKCYDSRPGSLCGSDSCPMKQVLAGKEEVRLESTKHKIGGEVSYFIITARPFKDAHGNLVGIVESFQDITDRKEAEIAKTELIDELKNALEQVKQLSGMLPICSSCKKIRDDKGYWNQIESYIRDHSEAEFSHGICPECSKKLYPEIFGKE